MKNLSAIVLLTMSITSFASNGSAPIDTCFMQEGKSTFFGKLTMESMEKRIQVVDSYEGKEVDGLIKGKKTYYIKLDNPNFIRNELAPGPTFKEQILDNGLEVNRGTTNSYYRVVTQDERVKDAFASNSRTSFCTHGSELYGHNTVTAENHPWLNKTRGEEVLRDFGVPMLYQVVKSADDIEALECRSDYVVGYTPESFEMYNLFHKKRNYEALYFDGQRVAATCLLND